jgi:head-tail adaptor
MVSAGRYTAALRHERQDPDLGDGRKREWTPTNIQIFGAIHQLRGEELMAAAAIEGRANQRIETHWLPEFRVADRLVEINTGRIFNIVALENFENRNLELHITCIEIVPA